MGSFFKFPAFTTLRILLSRFYCFYKTEFKTKKLLKILQKLFVLIGTHIRSRCVRMCKPTLLAPSHQLIRIRPTVAGLPPALSGPAFVADAGIHARFSSPWSALLRLRILLSRFFCFYKTEFKTKKLLKILQKLFVLIGTHIRSRCVRMCSLPLLAPSHQLIRIRPTVADLLPALSGPAFVADAGIHARFSSPWSALLRLRILLSRFYCFYKTEFKTKKLLNYFRSFSYLSGQQDSNLRPSGPKPDALPAALCPVDGG